MADLEDLFNRFMKDTEDHFGRVNNELKKKCTFDALEELRNLLNAQLENIKDLESKLEHKADKEWVSKMLKKLQEMISNLSVKTESDDAMFSKKPLLNSFCASCDSDIKHLRGVKAD